jgi:hypothetical protein
LEVRETTKNDLSPHSTVNGPINLNTSSIPRNYAPIKKNQLGPDGWLMPVILPIQEAEIRRISVQR